MFTVRNQELDCAHEQPWIATNGRHADTRSTHRTAVGRRVGDVRIHVVFLQKTQQKSWRTQKNTSSLPPESAKRAKTNAGLPSLPPPHTRPSPTPPKNARQLHVVSGSTLLSFPSVGVGGWRVGRLPGWPRGGNVTQTHSHPANTSKNPVRHPIKDRNTQPVPLCPLKSPCSASDECQGREQVPANLGKIGHHQPENSELHFLWTLCLLQKL